MTTTGRTLRWMCGLLGVLLLSQFGHGQELQRVKYHHPGLVVDLGVGLWAWPLPMDYDGDGDLDLLVSCPDQPSNGTYFFENPGGGDTLPVFKPGVRIGGGYHNIRVSYLDGGVRVLIPGTEFTAFTAQRFAAPNKLPLPANIHMPGRKIRANQWQYLDYNADSARDLIIAVGDWTAYGWDDAFNSAGEWTRGPLQGFVYFVRNQGSNSEPEYAEPVKIQSGGKPLEVFGWPSPCFFDADGDGDLDLVCGEFLDRLTYFENTGSRQQPEYAPGRFLQLDDKVLQMDLQMIVPTAIDWDGDGDTDLIVGEEDGRVAFLENTGRMMDGLPQFARPRFFQQQAEDVKFGALVTPYSFDWDGDGDEDLICGNTAGYIGFIENLDGGNPPRWAAPRKLSAAGEVIRIQAGPNGSIQGPCEAKWGYTTLNVADWDHDGLPDLIVNSIWGEVLWYKNVGTRTLPKLSAARPVEVEWPEDPPKPSWTWWQPRGNQLVTQWRTTPVVVDFNTDGLTDLVMLDHEGYLALFERRRVGDELQLLPGRRIFVDSEGKPLQLNSGRAGRSGRRKLHIVDWNGDGRLDLLANSDNADLWLNKGESGGLVVLKNTGKITRQRLGGHTSSPAVVDWDNDHQPDLLIGAEDGYLYYAHRTALQPNP